MSDRRSEIEATLAAGTQKRRGGLWVLAILLAVLGAGWLWWSGTGSGDAGETYRTDVVTRGDLQVTITATGTIEPLTRVEISSELSGTLSDVLVDFNDTVAKGQVLAHLDSSGIDAQLAVLRASHAAALAQLASAKATLDEARETYATNESLFARGVTTQSALDASLAALRRAEAAHRVAAANVDLSHATYEAEMAERAKTEIVSPIAGVVLDVAAEPGQIVAASLSAPTLFTIAEDLSQMELQADIAEADIGLVSAGDPATFTVEAYDQESFRAEVAQVRFASHETDGLVTYTAILSVDNPELRLRPGMTAVADITVAETQGTLLVPNAALRYAPPAPATDDEGGSGGFLGMMMPDRPGAERGEADGRTVWVLRAEGPQEVAVEPGQSDGSHTAILGGDLAEGEVVILSRVRSD